MCAGFKKAELLARVQGRKSNRHALAFITALSGKEEVYELDIELLEDEKDKIFKLKQRLQKQLAADATDLRATLAAIAELSTDYICQYREQQRDLSIKKVETK